MMHARRLGRAQHEFRFGGRELAVLGAVAGLIATLVFAAGIVVGRETTRGKAVRAENGREHRSPEPEGLRGGSDTSVKTAATRAEEKVTFYRTLTAPTQDLPQVGKPTIEERLVPKDEPVIHAPDPTPAAEAASRPAAETPKSEPTRTEPEAPRATAPSATPPAVTAKPAETAPRPARPARPPAAAQPARPGPTQVAAATPTTGPGPETWTVQVSAFRSRALAEDLRSRLAARGFDAYVYPSITEDGRPRYRVRVGTYPARGDAERAATELRSERGLNPLVTPRTR